MNSCDLTVTLHISWTTRLIVTSFCIPSCASDQLWRQSWEDNQSWVPCDVSSRMPGPLIPCLWQQGLHLLLQRVWCCSSQVGRGLGGGPHLATECLQVSPGLLYSIWWPYSNGWLPPGLVLGFLSQHSAERVTNCSLHLDGEEHFTLSFSWQGN